KGKSEPIDRKKPAAKPAKLADKPAAKIPEPEPEPVMEPFPDAMEPPFPEAGPINDGYEKMEEVSLEQLLEGRERPTTIGGSVPVPMDDIEELGTEELVPHEEPVATAVLERPGSAPLLEAEVREMRATLESLARDLEDLAKRVRARLR